jgi:uncharacterized protein YdeI (YjbR/CyaY-like superfamily)
MKANCWLAAAVPRDFEAALIQTAKRPETRARRIQEFVRMLERGEKIHS